MAFPAYNQSQALAPTEWRFELVPLNQVNAQYSREDFLEHAHAEMRRRNQQTRTQTENELRWAKLAPKVQEALGALGVHVYCSPYGSGKVDITVDQLAEILGLVEVSK